MIIQVTCIIHERSNLYIFGRRISGKPPCKTFIKLYGNWYCLCIQYLISWSFNYVFIKPENFLDMLLCSCLSYYSLCDSVLMQYSI